MSEYQTYPGYAGGLGIAKEAEAGVAVTPPTQFIEIESETMDETISEERAPGINGSRSVPKQRVVRGTKDARGGLVINGVKGADLALLLELLLGNYSSGTGYVGDLLPPFTLVKKTGTRYQVYAGCKLKTGKFESSQQAQALKFDATILAMSRADGVSDDFGSASYSQEASPLVHRRLTVTVGGTSVRVKRLMFQVDNPLQEDQFYNSQTRLALAENDDRAVAGELELDYNDANHVAIMTPWQNGAEAAIVAEYTNGVNVVTFSLPVCRLPAEQPKISGKGPMAMPVKFTAYASAPGARDEVLVLVRAV